jgi:glycosyltransferase involved in cell wall biosynthesis
MMRITIDGMIVDRCVSGIEAAIYGLAQALARYGTQEYRFFMRQGGRQPDVEAPHFHTCRFRLPGRARAWRVMWVQSMLPVYARRAQADFLHAAGSIAPRLAGVPVITTVYDLVALRFPQYCRAGTVLNSRLQLPASIRRAAAIITPSAATRNDLVDLFPEAGAKTCVIPLAVGHQFTPCVDEEKLAAVRRKYDLPREFILFLGRIEPRKNVGGILRAYRRLLDDGHTSHGLVIAGSRGWDSREVHRLIGQLDLRGRVRFAGYIAAEDAPALYSAAAVFVFPSFYEGFGLPPLEAMACGTPVVASARGSLGGLTGGAAVNVEPEDTDSIAAGLQAVISDPAYAEQLVRRGFARAASYSWEDTAKMTEAFYCDVKGW